jgi:cerevisin
MRILKHPSFYWLALCGLAITLLQPSETSAANIVEEIVAALPGFSVEELQEEVKDQIIVFKTKPSSEILQLFGQKAVQKLMSFAKKYMLTANIESKILESLKRSGIVEYSEPDYIARASNISGVMVQEAPVNWGLNRIDKRNYPLQNAFHYPASAGAGVNVYVLDTGINTAHGDLGGRAKFGTDFVAESIKTDDNGHGSFVAGLIGGRNFGVAKACNMISVKILDSEGLGPTSRVIRAIEYVIDKHKRSSNKKTIINLSLDAPASRALNEAIIDATEEGITVVVAAGNGDEKGVAKDACLSSPAAAAATSPVITVGAVDKNDRVASFSNYGKCVTLLAPGVNLASISNNGPTSSAVLSGTSFAAPLVTGVAALIMGESETVLTPQEIKDQIVGYATEGIISGIKDDGTPNRLLFGNLIAAKAGADMSAARNGRMPELWGTALAVVLAGVAAVGFY